MQIRQARERLRALFHNKEADPSPVSGTGEPGALSLLDALGVAERFGMTIAGSRSESR